MCDELVTFWPSAPCRPCHMEAGEGSLGTQRGKGVDFPQDKRYLKIDSGSSKVQEVLSYLQRLEDDSNPYLHLKDDIHTLRLMMSILILLIPLLRRISEWKSHRRISEWKSHRHYLQLCLDPIPCVLEDVIQEFEVFGRESIHLSEAKGLKAYSIAAKFAISNLAKLWLLKPEMRKLRLVVSTSANPPAIGIGADVVSFINSILKNLNDILCFKADLIILLKQPIEILQEKLLFLRNFVGFISEISISNKLLVELFTGAEALAADAASVLYCVLLDKRKGKNGVRENEIELLCVVERIMPFVLDANDSYVEALEASRSMIIGPFVTNAYALGFLSFLIDNVRELSNKEARFKVAPKHPIENLLDELNSVRFYPVDPPFLDFKEGLCNFRTALQDLIIDLACFICSNERLQSREKIDDLLDKVQLMKSATGDLIPRTWQSNFPSTNELGFIDFVLVNLRKLSHYDIASTDPLKCLTDTVFEELVALRHDFGEIAEVCKHNEELRALFTHFKDVAYQVEYFVDLSLWGAESYGYPMLGLTDVRESIGQVHGEVKAFTMKMNSGNLIQNIANGPTGERDRPSTEAAMGSKNEEGSNTNNATYQLVDSPQDKRARKRNLKIDFSSSEVEDVLSYLERRKDGLNPYLHLKDDICTLRLLMSILIPLFRRISEWKTHCQYLQLCLDPIACVLEDVIQEFEVFGRESMHLSEAKGLKPYSIAASFAISNLAKLWLMKPEMRKLHFVVSRFPNHPAIVIGTEVVSFINSLLENLNGMLCFKTDLIILLKEQIETLREKLLFLRNFLGFLSEISISNKLLVELFAGAEALAADVASVLYFVLLDKRKGKNLVRENEIELLRVAEKILPFVPDANNIYVQALEASRSMITAPFVTNAYALGIFYFLIDNSRFMVASNDGIKNLLDELNSVRCSPMDLPFHDFKEGLCNFRTALQDLIIDLACFICSNERLQSREKIDDLLDKVQLIKSASGDLIPRSWQSNFPSTNELGFIDFILMNLRELLHYDIAATDPLKCLTDTVYEELVALRHDFGDIAEVRKDNEELRALFTHFKDVAYQAEYFVDLSLCGAEPYEYQMLGLTDVRESIRQVYGEAKAFTMKMNSGNIIQNIANSATGEGNRASTEAAMGSKDEVGSNTDKVTYQLVGIEEKKNKIKEQLMGGPEQLNILSIVGMPGIGKTTLANSVYIDPEVTVRFHACAWCSVSQVYQKENLLDEILHQVQRDASQIRGNGLEQQLYKSLKGRRYLVIFDDLWDAKVWDDMRPCFPTDNNGSRVIFTTRNHDVAFRANSTPYDLEFLSEEDSWKLLQIKVFKEETCPLKLLEIGKRIAKNCKGLPLAVVLIAGLLKTAEQNQDCWERVGKQLRSYVVDYRPGEQSGIVELSYMHLPDYLKPCFLYFGAFKEDTEIPSCNLKRLWIAEGFVQPPKVGQNSLEYEAENYLNDLIDRSLVIIAKRSSRGRVKACRIHDLLHEFCLVRAQEERFLLHTSRHDKHPTWRISEVHEQYRLCIHSHSIPSIRNWHFESRVRTLLFSLSHHYREGYLDISNPAGSSPGLRCCYYLRGIAAMDKFRLLRVLDLGTFEIRDKIDFVTITHLVYLRYLAIGYCIREIPTEVANLKNLETFLLKGIGMNVPSEAIWRLVHLRHLHIGYEFNFRINNPEVFGKLSQLESLATLSTPALHCDKDIEKMLRNLPNLQKLKCVFLDSWDHLKSCNHFPVLDFLNQLESLTVFFSGKGLYPCNISFPLSLKKLTLFHSRLPWHEISIISRLPKLEVLKLLFKAFEGRTWETIKGEFQELKFLKLVSLDVAIWNVPSNEHLPHLEQLVLDSCYNLEEIPPVLGQIPTLRRIDMKWCNPSALHSVKQIEEEQHDMGNDQFNVLFA